jgi:GntR family transcriptional regulator
MPDFTPLFRRIMDDIRSQIERGELKPGERLPSTKALAQQYGVSLGSVRQAITLLIESGWLYGHQGLGVFVKGNPVEPQS